MIECPPNRVNFSPPNRGNSRRDGERKVCYRCGTHAHDRTQCKERVIRTEVLDGPVWEEVCRILSNPDVLEQEIERLIASDAAAHDTAAVERVLKETK